MKIIGIRGFTLVELMVTVAVLAIIAMMAVPSFTQTIRKGQLNSSAREFVDLLAETRSEAIFKQQNRTLTLDGSGGYKNWKSSNNIVKSTGVSSVVFNRLGQSTATTNQCFIFQNSSDSRLKAVVIVLREGIVSYDKTTTSCPT